MAGKSEHNAVPVTWPELIEDSRPVALYGLGYLRENATSLSEEPADSVAITLAADADTLSLTAVMLGPAECLPYFPPRDEHLRRVLRVFEGGITRGNSVVAIGVLNYLNVARCCGAELPSEAEGVEQSWLPQLEKFANDFTESESATLAFAALAAARLDLVTVFIGGGPLPVDFSPGKTFRFNVQGFVRYVAAALREGAAPEAVEPAWRDLVEHFPRKLASQTLRWVDLLWAARALMEHFERRPTGSVAAALHEFVT